VGPTLYPRRQSDGHEARPVLFHEERFDGQRRVTEVCQLRIRVPDYNVNHRAAETTFRSQLFEFRRSD
jgi:hypothetical protein